MNHAIVIVAAVIGCIAGAIGAVIVIETKTDKLKKDIADAALACIRANKEIENLKMADTATAVAIQKLIEKVQRERAGLWESVNNLWNKYEAEQEPEQEEEPEEPEGEETK